MRKVVYYYYKSLTDRRPRIEIERFVEIDQVMTHHNLLLSNGFHFNSHLSKKVKESTFDKLHKYY